jgi:ribosomal protein L29
MKAQKAELTATVDELEAQLAALKLQQTESKFQTDDSRMAKIKEDIRNLKTKVDVEREKLKLMPVAHDAAAPAAPTGGKSVDDILGGLQEPTKPAADAKPGTKLPNAD